MVQPETMQLIDEKFSEKKRRNLGARFKTFRELLNKSQKEFADELNVNPYQIRAIEEGEIFPGIDMINKLQKKYGLNITWLHTGKRFIFTHIAPKTPGLLTFRTMIAQYSHRPEIAKILDMMLLMEIPGARKHLIKKINEIKRSFEKEIKVFKQQNQNNVHISEKARRKVGNRQLAVGKKETQRIKESERVRK